MNTEENLNASYLTILEFLAMAKKSLIEIGAQYQLTAMQSMALMLLSQPRPMHSFTEFFNCDASNVTGIVDGLERKKLVSRFEDKADRRIKMVKIESQGSAMRDVFIEKLCGGNSPIFSKLSQSELATFLKLITKITQQ
jgi:DNA-binding MarR family transcriptional regulator